jgi:ABC-type proline/glycine betaine transport system substrate-binding protein
MNYPFVFSFAREKTKGWERKKGELYSFVFNLKFNLDNINEKNYK